MVMSLGACDILSKFIKEDYSGYEEYFTHEKNFTKYTSIDALNQEIDNSVYFWKKDESTNYTSYYTGKNILILVYSNEERITFSFTDGNRVSVSRQNNITTIRNDYVSIEVETDNKTVPIYTQADTLNIAKDDDGYLIVAYQKYMLYVTKDLKGVYVNEKNTSEFQGYSDTKVIPNSDLLTNTLNALGNDQRIILPAPSKQYEIWYGMDYYKDDKSHGTAYIADTHPKDYVEILKQNGYTVIRSWEDPFYAFYGNDGGYWYCYDEKEEISLIIGLEYYLYVSNIGKGYGPYNNTRIWFYHMRSGYNGGRGQTSNEMWSNYDLSRMQSWYDGTVNATCVPFIKLCTGYAVPSKDTMSYARECLLDGTLKLHSKCYNIYDNSPHYYLDGYDQILEQNGFHKYDPKCDLTNYEQRKEFQNKEESKYIECFINQEQDIAIKYYFDVNNGNTIRVFKLSEMQSWLQDEK